MQIHVTTMPALTNALNLRSRANFENIMNTPVNSKEDTIRTLHECEVLIGKFVPKVTVWHHKAPPSDAKL